MNENTLDARGLLCPMPVIRTQSTIQSMQPGEQLTVIATDPGVLHDIPAWCRVNGHILISSETQSDQIKIVVEVGSE